jgi:hypothetical protein
VSFVLSGRRAVGRQAGAESAAALEELAELLASANAANQALARELATGGRGGTARAEHRRASCGTAVPPDRCPGAGSKGPTACQART